MPPRIRELIRLERKVRELLKGSELPPPDRIEYGHQCIRLFWNEPRVALVVDLLEDGERLDPPYDVDEEAA
jgi:hypothetical protein